MEFGILAGLAALFLMLESATRSLLILVIVPAILQLIRSGSDRRLRERGSAGSRARSPVLTFALLLLAAALGVQALVVVREFRSPESFGGGADTYDYLLFESDFYSMTAFAVAVADAEGYTSDRPLVETALAPIPRSVWPGKPIGTGVELITRAQTGFGTADGGTTFGSVVGQYYLAGGPIAVAWIGAIFGFIGALADRLATRGAPTLQLLGFALSAAAVVWLRNIGPTSYLYLAGLVMLVRVGCLRQRTRIRAATPQEHSVQ
jgi:hypothetical protein